MNKISSHPFRELDTPRLWLKEPRFEHAKYIFAFNSSLKALEFIARDPYASFEEGQEKMRTIVTAVEEGKAFWWMFFSKETGEFVGYGGVFNINEQDRKAELGYGLLEPYWGKGLVSEALNPIVSFADTPLSLHRLFAVINPQNLGSRRVVEKLGFQLEGCLRDENFARNRYFDQQIYGRINPTH